MPDNVQEALSDHIKSLSVGNPEETFADTPTGGDELLDEEVESEPIQKRILGSEEEEFVETADEGTSDLKDEDETDYQKMYEAAQRDADGRLGEINKLRDSQREVNKNIQYMQEMFIKEQEQRNKEEYERQQALYQQQQKEYYGEEVVEDPHVKFLADQVADLRRQQYEAEQAREGRIRTMKEQYEGRQREQADWNNKMFQLKTQEEAFVAEHDDYYDAYQFAKDKRKEMYVRRGYSPEQADGFVFEEEKYLLNEQVQSGGNVAQEVYNLAKDYGWQGKQAENAAPAPTREDRAGDFDKIRAGLNQQGIGQMNGGSGQTTEDHYISAQQFYETVPEHIRAAVNADPEQFELLAKYGKVKVTW